MRCSFWSLDVFSSDLVLGRGWCFLMGWVFWGAYVFISGYVTLGFGGYLASLTGLPAAWGAVGLVLVCIAFNVAGVKLSGQLQVLVIALALAGLQIGRAHV